MITCPVCGVRLADGTKFCHSCGANVVPKRFCPNCGEQVDPQSPFCQNCGTPVGGPENKPAPEKKSLKDLLGNKELLKKVLLFGGIGGAVIAVLILVISLLVGGKDPVSRYGLYLKDQELMLCDLKKNEDLHQLTKDLLNGSDSIFQYSLWGLIRISEDGKYIFYPEKYSASSDDYYRYDYTLYFKELDDLEGKGTKIDSNVKVYDINSSAGIVMYTKGDDCSLYQYDIEEGSKDKISSDTSYSSFYMSEDGETVVFVTKDKDLYVKCEGEDKEKLASEISYIEYVSEDCETLYYTKDDVLYKHVVGKDREKLLSDVSDVILIYESGEMYFVRSEEEKVEMMDYVTDDMKEEYSWYRSDVEEETIELTYKSLYYYDGKKEVLISDTYTDYSVLGWEKPAIVYGVRDTSETVNKKLSEIQSYSDISDLEEEITASVTESYEMYVAVEDISSLIEEEDGKRFRLTPSCKALYYIDDVPEGKDYGDLYMVPISGSTAGKPELYDTDVWFSSYSGDWLRFLEDGSLCYFKDYSDGEADLYINQENIDTDVITSYFEVAEGKEILYYYVDWNEDRACGTLKVYDDGDVLEISEDVHDYYVNPDGKALFLYDYSTKRETGELHVWNGKKAAKIDEDVTYIIPIYPE